MRIEQEFTVPFRYEVVFTRDLFAAGNGDLERALAPSRPGGRARLVTLVDGGLVEARPDLPDAIDAWCSSRAGLVDLAAPVEVVPGGEEVKNSLEILDRFGQIAAATHLDRHSYVIIVGGGAVLDAVGWAASTVHRGIRQVRVPTTTVSQADSGVGVKNGVNRFGQKNYYGTFSPPHAVFIDPAFLGTLAWRDWISGAAEAFKVAIIRDRPFLEDLVESALHLRGRDEAAMEDVVRRSAEIHLDHIRQEGDAFESGSSRPLDFGHWAAHRLEEMTRYELRHGEAVAIGIAVDMHVASLLGLVSAADVDLILDGLEASGLAVWHDVLVARDGEGSLDLLTGLERFREHLGGELTLAMPSPLGSKKDIHELPAEVVKEALRRLGRREKRPRIPPEDGPPDERWP